MLLARLPGWDYLKTSYRDNLVRKGRKLILLVNQFQSQSRRCPRFASTFCLSLCLTADNQFLIQIVCCFLYLTVVEHFLEIYCTVEPRLTATSVIRSPRHCGHLFSPPGRTTIHFLLKKTLVNTVTRTARLFGPSGDRINGVPLQLKISYFSSTLSLILHDPTSIAL